MNTPIPMVQPIVLRDQLVAVVADGEALILATVEEADISTVKAMCLFAMELHAGDIDGPYTEARALAYAARVAGRRRLAVAVPRGRQR